jgi:hypothetical protein
MANTGERRQGPTNVTKRGARKNARVRDLLANRRRPGVPLGGAVVAREPAQPAVYQHNQTDLEFLR